MSFRKGNTILEVFMAAMFLFMIVVVPVTTASIIKLNSNEVITDVTIRSKLERCKTKNDCKFLIMTNKGVFENTDSLLNMKFNSSDFFNEIDVGEKYNIEVQGWRVPFLSWYQNIIKFQKVETNTQ